jgi:hypothetical protein
MLSGCRDAQTSADIGSGANTKAAGAMTTAFMATIRNHPTISYFDIVVEMRKFLKAKGFKQVPQLSSECLLNLSDCFMPEVELLHALPRAALRPPVRKALTVGINYLTLWPGRGRLSGCINDSETMIGIFRDTFGFMDNQICRLRDDRASIMPTKDNILAQLRWLTEDATAGDEMFFHYSGHGAQLEDNGDHKHGAGDTLLPCDFQTAGQISDDELREMLVDRLPQGCRLWVVLDCSHGGTALNLDFKVQVDEDGTYSCSRVDASSTGRSRRVSEAPQAEVIVLSGCKDPQTSVDNSVRTPGASKDAGAMTTALRHTISPTITCEELLNRMRKYLKRNHFDQVPQMSSDHFVQLDATFVDYQERKRNKRALPPTLCSRAATPTLQGGMVRQGHSSSAPTLTLASYDPAAESRLSRLEEEIARLRNQQSSSPLMGRSPSSPMIRSPQLSNRYSPSPILHNPDSSQPLAAFGTMPGW